MDPPGGSSGDPGSSSTPKDEPETSKGKGKEILGTEIDTSWCAITSSEPPHHHSSLPNAPSSSVAADLDTLWPGDVDRPEQLDPELDDPWCDDDQHDDSEPTSFLMGINPLEHDASTSSSIIPRFSMEPNMCSLRGEDLEAACSGPSDNNYRQFGTSNLGRQESLELLAESWAQLVPGGEIEKLYNSQDDVLRHFQEDLEQFLQFDIDPEAALQVNINPLQVNMNPLQVPPTLDQNPETPNDVDSVETMSSSVSIGDTDGEFRDSDPQVVTSTAEFGNNSMQVPGILKRKERVRELASDDVVAQPPQQQQQSIDTLQKKQKGPGDRPALPRTSQPRYAIQTRTEVDVIDDGYRWRKYGQKPVKNSAHPRNYYRCTTANCPVRKRVERSTENPSHVLTTYDGTHTHPENAPHSRESNPPANTAASGNAAPKSVDPPLPAPVSPARQPAPLGPPRLPPSNYIHPNIIGHLLAASSQVPPDQRRWSHPPPPAQGGAFFQRNLNLLRVHQFFRLHYGTQYPLLSNMLNLMRNFPQAARPPQLLDPRLDPRTLDPIATLMAAQNYFAMQQSGSSQIQDANLGSAGVALDQQQQGNVAGSPSGSLGITSTAPGPSVGPSTGTPVSIQQQRLLWMQELMGENLLSEGPSVQQTASDNLGAGKESDPKNNQDNVGDPS